MKIYLVMCRIDYEGSKVISAHLHGHTAQERADELNAKHENNCVWYDVQEEEVEQ